MWKSLIIILIGLVLFVFILLRVNLPDTWSILQHTKIGFLSFTLLSLIIMVLFKAIRWKQLLKMQGLQYSLWNCFLVYMSSLYWGNVIPSRIGDFIKILYLKEDLNVAWGKGASNVVVDRIFDLYALLIFGGLGILFYPIPHDQQFKSLVWVFFGLLILGSAVFLNKKMGKLILKNIFRRMMKNRFKSKTDEIFEEFHQGLRSFYRRSIFFSVFWTICSYYVFFKGCQFMALALQLHINLFYLAFCLSVVNIVSLLTFLGFGTREGTLILLFGLIALSKEQALAYSLLLFVMGTLGVTLVGLLCFLIKPIRWKSKMAMLTDRS
jgi:uncharacterized protein (TIRG00374 family)